MENVHENPRINNNQNVSLKSIIKQFIKLLKKIYLISKDQIRLKK